MTMGDRTRRGRAWANASGPTGCETLWARAHEPADAAATWPRPPPLPAVALHPRFSALGPQGRARAGARLPRQSLATVVVLAHPSPFRDQQRGRAPLGLCT